jgi:dTDP-glucose 4,6-dehydratase
MTENKKILITGSCGVLANSFMRRANFEKSGYTFASMDRINGDPNSAYSNKDHSFHIADILDRHIVNVVFDIEKPDIVIHGAALTNTDASLINPSSFINNNILGTQVIIDACLKHKVKKLVYLSADSVYGQLNSENETTWTEESPTNPTNPYSISKLSGELLVKAANTHGLIYNIVRSCNNYGPRQTTDKFIPKVIKCVRDNQSIPVYGQGRQMRDWLHIFDCSSALLTILKSGKDNQIYNVAAGQEYTNLEVVQIICNAMKKGHNSINFVADRVGHDFRYALNCNKIKELGWQPTIKFKDGIEDLVNWYEINKYGLNF